MANRRRGTRSATHRDLDESRKSNWGGWIRTTDLLINSQPLAPGTLPSSGAVRSGSEPVQAGSPTERHTKSHTRIKPLWLDCVTPKDAA